VLGHGLPVDVGAIVAPEIANRVFLTGSHNQTMSSGHEIVRNDNVVPLISSYGRFEAGKADRTAG